MWGLVCSQRERQLLTQNMWPHLRRVSRRPGRLLVKCRWRPVRLRTPKIDRALGLYCSGVLVRMWRTIFEGKLQNPWEETPYVVKWQPDSAVPMFVVCPCVQQGAYKNPLLWPSALYCCRQWPVPLSHCYLSSVLWQWSVAVPRPRSSQAEMSWGSGFWRSQVILCFC